MKTLKAFGAIYMSVDTYLTLVCKLRLVPDEDVTGVFPWPAEEACKFRPQVTPYSHAIAKNSAIYYWQLHNHHLKDWNGVERTFIHRAANTVSYRAAAEYQTVKRELRGLIAPVNPERVIIQFDWSAAEWNLILQHLGYEPPEDAYGAFVNGGANRDTTKLIVLKHVYGAMRETLYAAAQAEGQTSAEVDHVLSLIRSEYPLVYEWCASMKANRYADFNGFQIDLGEEVYKRPNRFAQTGLQLCKWELLSRLTVAGCAKLGCGDIHDQLVFDVDPINDRDCLVETINQIRKKCFDRYNLRPKFKTPAHTWA